MPKKPRNKAPKPKPRLYSIAQLAQDFNLSRSTATKRLAECPHSGESRGYPAYTLEHAAPFLIDPKGIGLNKQQEEPENEMDPDKMPPDMQKDYWDARLKKQKHDKEAGHLWDTLEVIHVLSEAYKPLAQRLRTLTDVLERVAGLDTDQLERAEEVINDVQQQIYDDLIEKFGGGVDV